jgi:uncharacterized SAM-dependent methyltransferase
MEENKAIDSKNIQFEYADNVASNVNREHGMVNDINQWFGQSAEAINDQTGRIIVHFQNNRDQKVSFDGIGEDLQAILSRQLRKFQPLG